MIDKLKVIYKEFKVSPFVVLSFALSVAVYYQNKSVLEANMQKYNDVIKTKDKQIDDLMNEKNEYKTLIIEYQREKQISNLLNK